MSIFSISESSTCSCLTQQLDLCVGWGRVMSEGQDAYQSLEGQEPGRQSYHLPDQPLPSPSTNPGVAKWPHPPPLLSWPCPTRTGEFHPHFHTVATSNCISLPRPMHFISLAAGPAGAGRKEGTVSDNPSAAKGRVFQPRDNPINPLSKGPNGMECPLSLL